LPPAKAHHPPATILLPRRAESIIAPALGDGSSAQEAEATSNSCQLILTLLIYRSANGSLSSRKIERPKGWL